MSELTKEGAEARERVLERWPLAFCVSLVDTKEAWIFRSPQCRLSEQIIGCGPDESSAWTSAQQQMERGESK